jgi:hypothetical protein
VKAQQLICSSFGQIYLSPFTCLIAVVVMFGIDHGWPWLTKALIMVP